MSKLECGKIVQIAHGAFADCCGILLDQEKPVDGKGRALPPALPGSGFRWILLTLNGTPVVAYVHDEDLGPVAVTASSTSPVSPSPNRGRRGF